MLRMRGRRRRALNLEAEIRLTNLIDVAFVLLIIFMITAPILQGGVDVELPEADAVPIEAADAVVITIERDGTIYLNKTRTTLAELPALVRTYGGGERAVSLNADRNVSYGLPVQVLAGLHREGITNVALVVDQEPEQRRR
ncbi:MAG TPA: biopolymer transporter ExbD [Longimicrobiales bacterium]|nr:biopolymer transporter ExbD [Longimicrobiales bacterium]